MGEEPGNKCEVRIWCPDCERSEYTTKGEKYLCVACGKVMESNHEVHHEIFPHVSGDKDHLA
jgi:hypothetical protein